MKKIRLPLEVYEQANRPCAITICSIKKADIFKDSCFVNELTKLLLTESPIHAVRIFVFCFMLDHLHMIIMASDKIGIIDFVRIFKSKATKISWDFGFNGKIFQSRFYDHYIRTEEKLLKQIRYVIENPLRKGLPEYRMKYPYVGSNVFDQDTLIFQ